MQTIGERLEEARKRKGISLREAAEATKVRGDFLASIEQNKFDFDLPDIYKRGFLKNYTRYLKLDVEKTMADYNAQQLSNARLGKKGANEWFGHMEIKSEDDPAEEPRERPESGSETSPSLGRIQAKPSSGKAPELTEPAEESDKTFYLKIGLIFVGTLALVFVLFGLVWAILGSGKVETGMPAKPELRDTSTASEKLQGEETQNSATSTDSLTLTASGNVYVLVKEGGGNTELLRKTLSEGESVTLDKNGPVDVLFTAGEFLTIEHNGERMRPSSSGTAKISIP
tara:strand:+ start:585 stop:1439 length:855 start_codon:yes stop_codon:yes gene_type:complete